MLELKVSGNSIQELYQNAAHTFMLLARGGEQLFAAQPETPAQNNVDATPGAQVAEPVGDVTKMAPAETKTAKRKAAVVIEAKPIPEGGDEVPDLTDKPLDYVKDVKPLIIQLVKKHEDELYAKSGKPREDATQEDKDAVMQQTMTFMMGLFKPFGVKKGPDLKPDQLAAFVAAAKEKLS